MLTRLGRPRRRPRRGTPLRHRAGGTPGGTSRIPLPLTPWQRPELPSQRRPMAARPAVTAASVLSHRARRLRRTQAPAPATAPATAQAPSRLHRGPAPARPLGRPTSAARFRCRCRPGEELQQGDEGGVVAARAVPYYIPPARRPPAHLAIRRRVVIPPCAVAEAQVSQGGEHTVTAMASTQLGRTAMLMSLTTGERAQRGRGEKPLRPLSRSSRPWLSRSRRQRRPSRRTEVLSVRQRRSPGKRRRNQEAKRRSWSWRLHPWRHHCRCLHHCAWLWRRNLDRARRQRGLGQVAGSVPSGTTTSCCGPAAYGARRWRQMVPASSAPSRTSSRVTAAPAI
mmetsp:Transcript_20997/g.46255  ORF Transcript_20997/g.46255 Transcript_20997/m.46255 type:complete len:339 (+) Transcript_20997:1193-2209(+)